MIYTERSNDWLYDIICKRLLTTELDSVEVVMLHYTLEPPQNTLLGMVQSQMTEPRTAVSGLGQDFSTTLNNTAYYRARLCYPLTIVRGSVTRIPNHLNRAHSFTAGRKKVEWGHRVSAKSRSHRDKLGGELQTMLCTPGRLNLVHKELERDLCVAYGSWLS